MISTWPIEGWVLLQRLHVFLATLYNDEFQHLATLFAIHGSTLNGMEGSSSSSPLCNLTLMMNGFYHHNNNVALRYWIPLCSWFFVLHIFFYGYNIRTIFCLTVHVAYMHEMLECWWCAVLQHLATLYNDKFQPANAYGTSWVHNVQSKESSSCMWWWIGHSLLHLHHYGRGEGITKFCLTNTKEPPWCWLPCMPFLLSSP